MGIVHFFSLARLAQLCSSLPSTQLEPRPRRAATARGRPVPPPSPFRPIIHAPSAAGTVTRPQYKIGRRVPSPLKLLRDFKLAASGLSTSNLKARRRALGNARLTRPRP
jgi:hypothetical protein